MSDFSPTCSPTAAPCEVHLHSTGVRQYTTPATAEADELRQAPSLAPSCSPSSRCRGACSDGRQSHQFNIHNNDSVARDPNSDDSGASAQRRSVCELHDATATHSYVCHVQPQS